MRHKIIDSHYHASSRCSNDYEALSLSGVKQIIEPSHRLRQKIKSKADYLALINRRMKDETYRANAFGVKINFGIGLMPCDFEQEDVFADTLEHIIHEAVYDNVCCYGEVELDTKEENYRQTFIKQLTVFCQEKLPVIINIPHINRDKVLKETFAVFEQIKEYKEIVFDKIILDGVLIHELPDLKDYGFGAYGVPVSPRIDAPFVVFRKSYPEEILATIKKGAIDIERVILNSSMGFGYGDPWGLAKTADILYRKDIPMRTIEKIFHDNATKFFNLK